MGNHLRDSPCSPGAFLYGLDRLRGEIPYDFLMDIYPVTNEQYKMFMLANGYGS